MNSLSTSGITQSEWTLTTEFIIINKNVHLTSMSTIIVYSHSLQ